MSTAEIFILVLCLVSGHAANTLNRILEYWQPSDVYVILNSTIRGEDAIGAMAYPRFVSARGDFSHFIPQNPIQSVFPDNFVLVLFTDETRQSVIPILRNQLSQKIIVKRSKIVIVTGTMDVEVIEKMFRELWQMGLLNVFLVDDLFIFGFNPFTNAFPIQHPVSEYERLISIDRAANFYGKQLKIPLIETYPGAQHISWYNRSVVIGSYISAQQPLAEYFNATLYVYTPKVLDFGFEFFQNATSSVVHPGVGEELVLGRGDLTLMHRSYAASNYFDSMAPLYFSECNLLTPKSERVPPYTILVSVAFSWVGLSSIITLCLIAVYTVIMKRVLHTELDMMRFVFELASVFVGQSFSFRINSLSLRFAISCWLITSILLGTLFNAQIVTNFLTPMFVSELDNPFEAIRGDGFLIYTFDDLLYYLRGNSKELFSSEEEFQLLLTKLRGVTRGEFFDRIMHPNGRDMFLVIAKADNLIEKTKYLTEQTYSYHQSKSLFEFPITPFGIKKDLPHQEMDPLPLPVLNNLITNIVPRGSIIYHHYNDFNYRIFEAGLLQHWRTLELLYEIKFGSGNEAQEKSLTCKDLYSAFLVLLLGYALAAAVFAVEMLCAHFRTKFSGFSL